MASEVGDDGVLFTDHTRMTQRGTWNGVVHLDGEEVLISGVPRTKDRSWGTRQVGPQPATNRPFTLPQVFWLWAPLHFKNRFTHFGLHEYADGRRWFETALVLEPLSDAEVPWGKYGMRECHNPRYELEWEPGTREMRSASLSFYDPVEGETHIKLEKLYTFRMRGVGYNHPYWNHASVHGDHETGRESIVLADFDPSDLTGLHLQTVVKAHTGERTGIGVPEQVLLGDQAPTGLKGIFDGYQP